MIVGILLSAVVLIAPPLIPDASTRSAGNQEPPERVVLLEPAHAIDEADHVWRSSPASFYGPGLYGRRMACPPYEVLTPSTQAVAHRDLPCGTHVRLRHEGREIVVQVKDSGPAAWTGKTWDLTAGTCYYLSQDGRSDRCRSGPIEWTL